MMQQIWVDVPGLQCFGCHKSFPPVDTSWPDEILLTRVLDGPTFAGDTLYRFGTEQAMKTAADAAGWRRVTLYGQVIVICPECRATRNKPEWERHL